MSGASEDNAACRLPVQAASSCCFLPSNVAHLRHIPHALDSSSFVCRRRRCSLSTLQIKSSQHETVPPATFRERFVRPISAKAHVVEGSSDWVDLSGHNPLGCGNFGHDGADEHDHTLGAATDITYEMDPTVAMPSPPRGGRDSLRALDDDEDDGMNDDDDDRDEEDDDEEDEDVDEEIDEGEDLDGFVMESDDDGVSRDAIILPRVGRVGFDDDDITLGTIRVEATHPGSRPGRMDLSLGGVEVDEEDEVVDYDDASGDILELSSIPHGLNDDDIDIESEGLLDVEEGEDVLDSDDEELLKEAASVFAGGSLSALGLDGAMRGNTAELTSFALGEEGEFIEDEEEEEDDLERKPILKRTFDDEPKPLSAFSSAVDETEEDELPPGLAPRAKPSTSSVKDFDELVEQGKTTTLDDLEDIEEFEDVSLDDSESGTGPKNLDGYVDKDEDDDESDVFGVTTEGAFGRVWELNDDTYVTITEPGETYTYEIEERDEEDQDSATMRRGKDAGWGRSLQSDSRRDLPVGSREWIARRSYELMTESSYEEMFHWTRRNLSPPKAISALFEMQSPAHYTFGKLNKQVSMPQRGGQEPSNDIDIAAMDFVEEETEDDSPDDDGFNSSAMGLDALERAVDFPCKYRFKVVGSGEGFATSIAKGMESIIGRKVPDSAFSFEPAGRYQRIVINIDVENAREVSELCDVIRNNPMVKFSYG